MKGGFLIDAVVDPIGKEEAAVGSPFHDDFLVRVIPLKVVDGDIDGQALVYIPDVFPVEAVLVVFVMPCNKDKAVVLAAG